MIPDAASGLDVVNTVVNLGTAGILLYLLQRSEQRFDKLNTRILDLLEQLADLQRRTTLNDDAARFRSQNAQDTATSRDRRNHPDTLSDN